MRAVAQRVARAKVTVDEKIVGEIGKGLVVLLGIARDDTKLDAAYLAEKITALRIFDDDEGKMNLSVKEAVCGLPGSRPPRRKSPGLCTTSSLDKRAR